MNISFFNSSAVELKEFSEEVKGINVAEEASDFIGYSSSSVGIRILNGGDRTIPASINFNTAVNELSFVYIPEPCSELLINGFNLN